MKRATLKYGLSIFVINALMTPTTLFSQNQNISASENLLLEGFFNTDEDQLNTGSFEAFDDFLRNPIDLNSTTAEELAQLYILDNKQIQSFLKYRKHQGMLLSIYELQAIYGFDWETIRRLLPYVKVDVRKALGYLDPFTKRLTKPDKHFLIYRYTQTLNVPEGYSERDSVPRTYLGSPSRMYFRYLRRRAGDYSVGFTMEKDPGEKLLNPNSNLPDFYSFHTAIYDRGKIKRLLIGDYQFQSGQGLLFTSGFHLGSNEPVKAMSRFSTGISPYTSSMESGFFRGGAVTLNPVKSLFVSTFYSNRKLDANLGQSDNGNITAESLPTTGLHRKISELDNQKKLRQEVIGGDIRYKKGNFELGSSFVKTVFWFPIELPNKEYNKFYFNGQSQTGLSGYYKFRWKNFRFFGETATTGNGSLGHINGFVTKLAPEISISFVHRSYSKDFNSLYGGAFGENTRNNNEKGVFVGLSAKPAKGWEVATFFNKFSFPWLRYRVDKPSRGESAMIRIKHQPKRWLMWHFQLNYRSKGLNLRNDSVNIDMINNTEYIQYRLNFDYTTNQFFKMRTRVQMSTFSHTKSTTGITLFQDFNFSKENWSLGTRFALFDTDYDTRQYVYEKDLLYSFSVPAYYGQGTRTYFIFHWKPSRKIDFWTRYAVTHLANQFEKGSGADRIDGNIHPEIKFQIMLKL